MPKSEDPQASAVSSWHPVEARSARLLVWLSLFGAVAALVLAPEWVSLTRFDGRSVRVDYAPWAVERARDWFDGPADGLTCSSVELKADEIRVDWVDPEQRSASLALRPLALGRRGNVDSASFAVFVVTPSPDLRMRLMARARRFAERDDGSLIRAVHEAPAPRLPGTYRLLGLVPLAAMALFLVRDKGRRPSPADSSVKRTHVLPVAVQLVLFGYWSLYWEPVRGHVTLVLAQLAFAYVLDLVLAWGLRRPWPGLLAVGAPVLSANLFVWFTGSSAWAGFALIAVALASKALIRRGGRHIFNPSALGASVLGLATIAFPDHVRHVDIAFPLNVPPNMAEVMWLVTLLPLTLLGTAPLAVGAALALSLSDAMASAPSFAWPGWFLAVTIFSGDPATIPRSPVARFLTGLLVGAGIFGFAKLLVATTGIDFWAKVFPVPLVNLLVPRLERVGARWGAALRSWAPRLDAQTLTRAGLAAWALVFLAALRSGKPGGFSARTHGEWGTPFVRVDGAGRAHCGPNAMFCRPFRFDLEVRAWLRGRAERATPGAP